MISNKFCSLVLVGVGVVMLLTGCKSSGTDTTNQEIINQLDTDVIQTNTPIDSSTEVNTEVDGVDDNQVAERVEVDVQDTGTQSEQKTTVPNANRSSYSYNEVKFFDGLDTGSFTLKVSRVDGDTENQLMTMDIRGDRRTEIVKMDVSMNAGNSGVLGIQSYIDLGNAVAYMNRGSGWEGTVNDSGIDNMESLAVSSMFGTDWSFDRTDEYFAYFKKTGNNCDIITSILYDEGSVGYTLVSGEMKINRETLRMVSLTQTGVVSTTNSETGEIVESNCKITASIQDINSLGTIMLPSEIADSITVDRTQSNTTTYQ